MVSKRQVLSTTYFPKVLPCTKNGSATCKEYRSNNFIPRRLRKSRNASIDQFSIKGICLRPIKSDRELERALARIDELWGSKPDTPKGDELDVLMLLVEKYEDEHYPIPASDPIEAIKFLMEQKDLSRKDLEPYIGTSARVSEILNKKRSLTLSMIKKLHEGLNIPYECLIA